MKKTLKKILCGIISASMLMSSAVAVYAEGETTTTNPWETAKSEDTFRFGIMSDTHIAPGGASDTMKAGLSAFANMGVDALALAGDISISEVAHTSTTVEDNLHTSVKAALEEYKYEIKADDETNNDAAKLPMVYAMGNHELATNHQNAEGIWYAKELFANEYGLANLASANVVDGKYTGDYVANMGGYTFIVSSPNHGLNDAYQTNAYGGSGVDVESWVLEQIEAADEAYGEANKPIFYIQHYPVNDHYGKTGTANTAEFMNELKNYPNVIVISAHVHNLIEDPRLISQDPGYTSIITGVMSGGQASVWNGNISGIGTGVTSTIAQQMAIDVDYDATSNTSDIEVYRMDVVNGEFIGEPYEFTLDGNAQTKYSTQSRYEDEGRSTAAWSADASITATAVDGTRSISVTYPTDAASATVTAGDNADVLQDDFLWGYKIFAINKSTGEAEQTKRQAFEFFRTPTVSERTATFEELARNQEYEIRVYPITVFQYADTYAELDAAGVTPLTQTVKTNNVKSAAELAQQMTRDGLVSYNKSATYIQNPGETLTMLTDGKPATSNNHVSEVYSNGVTGVGFIIDLERSYKVNKAKVHTYGGNPGGRGEFKIYGSNDGTTWKTLFVRTTSDTNDDFGKNLGTTEKPSFATNSLTCNIEPEYARYVKIEYPYYALLTEMEVYATDIPVTNVAYGKDVELSDTFNTYLDSGAIKASNAVDGNNNTAVYSNYSTSYRHYMQIDLGKKYPIGMVEYHKWVGNADVNGKSYWTAYGSNEVTTKNNLQDLNYTLDSEMYTSITHSTNTQYGASVDVITETATDEAEYQYITVRKRTKNAFLMGEFRAFVINPTVADFSYDEGTASLTFTDAMNFDNVNEDITVYDSEGTAKTVTFTTNDDNTVVTFAAEAGDKVVVSQNITNKYGTDMQEDAEYDIYDLSIDYSGKTTKKFENMNVAYGKDVITDYSPDQTPPDGVPDYYYPLQLTNGVEYGLISATDEDFIVDLGRAYNLNNVVLKLPTSNANEGAKIHFTLSGSADGETWTTIHKAPTDQAKVDSEIWNGKVGTFTIDDDVNYRYIKYSHPYYFVMEEIEAYADVEATKVTQNTNTVTSSAVGETYQSWNKYLVDNSQNLTYVNGSGYNWISVEMDQAYPVGMYELYVREWKESGAHNMDNWQGNHKVRLYGSNSAPVEQLDEETTNLSITNLTPYGFDELGETFEAWPWSGLFPSGFGKSSLMPEGWIFTDGYKETLNNTKRYKNLTLKKYDTYTMEFGEFRAYVLNATVNVVDADNNGIDIHFGDKMVSDLLNEDTVTLVNADGEAVDFNGTLSDNGMVYTLDAELADGFYTLTVADDVKNVLGVPMQADYTCEVAVGDVYGIKTADGGDVEAIAANTTYVVTEPVSGENARMAIVGIYNSDNVLVTSAIESIPADYAKAYTEVEITTPTTLAEGEYYVRYFLWNAETFAPALSESIKVFE